MHRSSAKKARKVKGKTPKACRRTGRRARRRAGKTLHPNVSPCGLEDSAACGDLGSGPHPLRSHPITSALVLSVIAPGLIISPVGAGDTLPGFGSPVAVIPGGASAALLPALAEAGGEATPVSTDSSATPATPATGAEEAGAEQADVADEPADGDVGLAPAAAGSDHTTDGADRPEGGEAEGEDEAWQPAPAGDPATGDTTDGEAMPPEQPGEAPAGAPDANDGARLLNPLPIEEQIGECVVSGEVSNASTLEPIAGAIVSIPGTGREDETDAQGRFRIEGLPAGDFTVEAQKLGFGLGTAPASPRPGSPVEVRISLEVKRSDSGDGEFVLPEEVVVGEYQETSQGDFNLDLEVKNTVSSGLSKDDFTKTGVSDAAGAVGKVAGANIVGGKFAVVRGLADRYVTTLFNGAAISSADPSRKAVQLDIFPTTAIQRIDVNKTYWPNLPGDFGGGTIQINSLNLPESRIAEFKYKYGWNSTHEDRMLVHPNRDLGFWGDVDDPIPDNLFWNLGPDGEPQTFKSGGRRITPGNTNNQTLRQRQLEAGLTEQAAADEHIQAQRALDRSQSFMPAVESPEPAESFSLVYGDKVAFENGNEFGFIAAFQHGTSDEVNARGEENRLTEPFRSWQEESYAREVDWSVYVGAGLKVGENHELAATYFKKHIATDEITHGTNFEVEGDIAFGSTGKNDAIIRRYGASAIYSKEFWTIDPVIRDTELIQLRGSHRNDVGTRLSWTLTDSLARESRPHTSNFQNGMLDFTDPRIEALAASNPGFIYNPSLGTRSILMYSSLVNDGIGSLDSSRETQFIEENGFEASLDLTQNLYFSDEKDDGPRLEFSFGGSHLDKDREQSGRIYLLRTASWERWIQRNPPSWWTSSTIAPFSPGSPLDATTLLDGSPLPEGYLNLGEYLAANPDALIDYYNGYGSQQTGVVPGTGSGSSRAFYVQPDAPFYLNGSGLEVRNVDSNLTLVGLYAAGTYHAERWRFGGGGRWEEEIKDYAVAAAPLTLLQPNDSGRFGDLTTSVFIPSVVAGIDLIPEKAIANFAWSRTVARPTFHEFLPIQSIAQDTGIVRRGNPDLTETGIENFDASLELNPTDGFTARISAFHKALTDPIVVVQRVDLGVNSNTYVNGNSGTISGFELEGSWKGDGPLSIFGNYAYINSTLNYDVNQGLVVTPLETRFPFQPSQILNLTVGWEPEDSPWSVFLTTNFTDEYPTILRSDPNEYDVWVLPQLTLDLLVSRKFHTKWLDATLSLGIKNLTEEDRRYEYRGGPVGGPAPYEGLTYTVEDPGRTFYLEFKGTF